MNPGVFVMGGGGAGGGKGGRSGKGGKGRKGKGGRKSGQRAAGGGKGAKACGPGSGGGCMNPVHGGGAGTHAGDPVDVATGRVYTLPQTDLVLTGPLLLPVQRFYSSFDVEHDVGLGHGWTHTLSWSIQVRRRTLTVRGPQGVTECALPPVGGTVEVADGGLLRRDDDGFSMSLETLFYGFEPAGGAPDHFALTVVADRSGNRVALEYDAAGRLAGARDSLGREVRFPRGPDGRIKTMSLVTSRGRVASYRRYEHDAAGNLIATVDALGRVTSYGYDDARRLVRLAYPSGLEAHYRYDRDGRCVETWCARPHDTSLAEGVPAALVGGAPAKGVLHYRFERDEASVTVVDSRQSRRFDLGPDGAIEMAAGVWVEQITCDERDEAKAYSDPTGAVTEFERDERGRLTAVVEPTGARTSYAYTPRGDLREEVDALGAIAEYRWNDAGNLLEVGDALGQLMRYSYDARGLRTGAEMPNGGLTATTYDAEANPVRVVEPDGGERTIDYDDEGRVVSVRDQEGFVTRFAYDAMGALRQVVVPGGRSAFFERDPDGHLQRYVDPTGAAFEFLWGGSGVVTEVRKATGERVRLRYDREQNLVEVHNELGEVHRIERDPAGRVVGETCFDGRTRRFRLDAAGRVERFIDGAGDATTIERDAAGRVIRRDYADGRFDAFEYDAIGRLVQARTEATSVTYAYDARGNCVKEAQECAGERASVESAFDATGALVERSCSPGPTIRYERDASRRPVRVALEGAGDVARVFDGLGREVLRELPGGGRVVSRWQGLSGLAERKVFVAPHGPPAAPVWSSGRQADTVYAESFTRNEMGALVEHTVEGGPHTRVALDPLGRITQRWSGDQTVERYAYQGAGRVHDVNEGAAARRYGAGGALLAWGDLTFEYDGEARRTAERDLRTGRTTRHEWDGRGLLVATKLPDGSRVDHTYDAHARRLEKRLTRPDGTQRATRFVWSGDVLQHERTTEIGPSGARVVAERAYVYDDDEGLPVAHVDLACDGQPGAGWTYYVLGEGDFPALLLAGDGRVRAQLRPTVRGRLDDLSARATTPLRFAGQYEDEETGLFYNRYRFYDPNAGLFVNADPVGIEGGWNAFEYAQSTPWMVVDPEGLEGVTSVVMGGGVKGAGDSKTIRKKRPVGQREPAIHPVVADALPKAVKHGDGELYPKGAHSPTNCAEPEALSNYIREWEKKHNEGRPLDPEDPKDRKKIQKCMQDINLVTAKQENGKGRAPCPNCSQLLSNLKDKWGGPKTKAITPGASGPSETDRVRSTPPSDKRWKKARGQGKVK